MKLNRIHLMLAAITIFYAAAEARSDEPDWYKACKPVQGNIALFDLCIYSQSTFEVPCKEEPLAVDANGQVQGDLSADKLYSCLNAYYPPVVAVSVDDVVAPDGSPWRDHYLNNDINRVKAEACVACLKTARNRKSCKGC